MKVLNIWMKQAYFPREAIKSLIKMVNSDDGK